MKNKKSFWLSLIQILLVAALALYLPLRDNGAPTFLFWPIFLSIIVLSLKVILTSPRKHKIISLVVLEICFSLLLLVSAPHIFQMNRDSYFEAQYSSTIIEEGIWNPEAGIGFAENYYGYNPGLHFSLAFSSIIAGISTYVVSKYVFFIVLRLLLVLLVFLIVSVLIKKSKERMVYLATFIFIASSGMAFVEVSRRFFAAIFMLLSVYALLKSSFASEGKRWNLLFYVFSPLVVIGNHSIAYLLLVFLFGMWLFGIFSKTKLFKSFFNTQEDLGKYPDVFLKFIYFLLIFGFWQIFVSAFLLKNDLSYLLSIFELMYSGYGVKLLFNLQGAKPATFIYHSYEILTVYLYHILFILLGLIGLLFFVKKLRLRSYFEDTIRNKDVLLYIGIFSLLFYIPSYLLMRTQLDSASYTFLWFFCIPLSIFIAYLIDEIYTRRIYKTVFIFSLILISILFYTGHVFSGIYTPRITNRAPNEDVVLGMDIRSQTQEVYYSGLWLKENADEDDKVLGDINVFEVYSGLFEFEVSTDEYKQDLVYNGNMDELEFAILDDGTYFGAYEHTAYNDNIDYLIINNRFFIQPNYLFGGPVGLGKANKFAETELINKVYDNGEVSIYKVVSI